MSNVHTATVPTGASGMRNHEATRDRKRGDVTALVTTRAVIVQLYDKDFLLKSKVPDQLLAKMIKNTGVPWALVQRVDSGATYYLPFKDSPKEVLASNPAALKGQFVSIHHRPLHVEDGYLTLVGKPTASTTSHKKNSHTNDIGGIFG